MINTDSSTSSPQLWNGKAPRNSNLEVLRILSMLAIIAHHYVVNSSVMSHFVYEETSSQQYFLEVWGMWGKTAINSFILISGYFLCKMQFSWERYAKLLVEIFFYKILITLIFSFFGYQELTLKVFLNVILEFFRNINDGFTPSFMVFYAFVPIYNKLISALSKKELTYVIAGLLFIMTICSTFIFSPTMNEPLWYMVLYLIAAYVRLYPNRFSESLRTSGMVLLASVAVAVAMAVGSIFMANYTGNVDIANFRWWMVANSNKLLALVVGASAFLFFKNLPEFNSRTVNTIAAGTFAVLLIHASSDTMRQWLWQDVCRVHEMFYADLSYLIIQALLVPIIIFLVCVTIDFFRREYLEKPLFKWFKQRKMAIAQ